MFFWVFLAIALVGALDGDRDAPVRLAQAHFAVAAVAFALAYLGLKLLRLVAHDDTSRRARPQRPRARRLRQGQVVRALGSLRIAEPLRRDVVGLAG